MKTLRWFTLMQLAGMFVGLLIVWLAVAYAFHDRRWWWWVDLTLSAFGWYLVFALGAWWGLRHTDRHRTAQTTALAAAGIARCPTCDRPVAVSSTENGAGPGGLVDLTDIVD